MAFKDSIFHYQDEIRRSKKSLDLMEEAAFTGIEGNLGEYERITQEYLMLSTTLAFHYDCEYEEYRNLNRMIKRIGEYIDNRDFMVDSLIVEAIKEIIVYLQLHCGCKVSFYKTFDYMLKNKKLLIEYNVLKQNGLFDFQNMMSVFYNDLKEKSYTNSYYYNDFDEAYFTNDRLVRIFSTIKGNQKYYKFYNLLLEVTEQIKDIQTREELIFYRKVLSFLEINLCMKSSDKEIVKDMIENDEFTYYDYEENITLGYLKEKFHYDTKRRGL